MKKLFATLASFGLMSVASAVSVTLDDFSVNQGPLRAGIGANPNPMCDNNGTREICEQSISNPLNLDHKVQVQNGFLNISNETLSDTQASVKWNIGAGLIPAGATNGTFNFVVIASDGNPTTVEFFFNGVAIPLAGGGIIAPNTLNSPVSFNAPLAALSTGGVLELRVNGAPGWDLVLDSLGVSYTAGQTPVPAPGIAFLLGAGLLGLSLRRRK